MHQKPHLDLDNYVPALLNFLSNKLAATASKEYKKRFGVGVLEWRMLSMLAVEDHITANRICQVIGLDKGGVSRSLHKLQQSEHVKFEVDPTDARRQVVSLTAKGWKLHDQILTVALKREQILLGGLSQEEIKTLIGLLRHLHGRVGFLGDLENQ